LSLKPIGDLTVFSGANDVGKSNILKALNLFFNDEVDWLSSIDFYRDFSLRRLDEVRRESIKGKQFISIEIEFARPPNYEGSLPPTFKIKKTWFRDSSTPKEENDLERREEKLPSTLEVARRFLSHFVNRVHFEYVPAIRDRAYFEHVLENLQESLVTTQMDQDDPILDAIRGLNVQIRERARSLRDDFQQATSIAADVSFPPDLNSLFRALSVTTTWRQQVEADSREGREDQRISLALRGDGIQARYVPSLLSYIAENSSDFYIWGFEEPENSVEYNLAVDLANEFRTVYADLAQIFVTSHSPAFVSLQGERVVSYRVFKNEDKTEVAELYPSQDEECLHKLSEDIGLFRIQKGLHEQYLEKRKRLEDAQKETERLREELERSTTPTVYLEGKTDAQILRVAWREIHPDLPPPFSLKHCDPLPQGPGGSGGAATLKDFLRTVRFDNPHVAIGIFDRDKEGCDQYNNLPAYFEEISDLEAKVSKNRKAAAFLLPIPPGRGEYAKYSNLCIEFFFGDEVLERKTTEGYGLVLEQPEIESRVKAPGHAVIATETSDLLATRQIKKGKTVFSEEIVPDLEANEFEHFRMLFEKIQELIDFLR
jgi:glutaredoxin